MTFMIVTKKTPSSNPPSSMIIMWRITHDFHDVVKGFVILETRRASDSSKPSLQNTERSINFLLACLLGLCKFSLLFC
jgi:hypothetical protein